MALAMTTRYPYVHNHSPQTVRNPIILCTLFVLNPEGLPRQRSNPYSSSKSLLGVPYSEISMVRFFVVSPSPATTPPLSELCILASLYTVEISVSLNTQYHGLSCGPITKIRYTFLASFTAQGPGRTLHQVIR